MLYVFLVSLVLIMIGELADKSQLLALVLATRYRVWQVLLGIFIATFVVHFVSTAVGQAIGSVLPPWLLPWVSGLLFIGFGIWTLRGDTIDESDADRGVSSGFGPVFAVAVAFFLAELGDKTQIMTMTIAADPGGAIVVYLREAGASVDAFVRAIGGGGEVSKAATFWGVTLGSTLGMVLADALAILVGSLLGKRLPERLLSRISGVVFILFGVVTIAARYL